MMTEIPEKIVLRSTTKISLNNRFVQCDIADYFKTVMIYSGQIKHLIWHNFGTNVFCSLQSFR